MLLSLLVAQSNLNLWTIFTANGPFMFKLSGVKQFIIENQLSLIFLRIGKTAITFSNIMYIST